MATRRNKLAAAVHELTEAAGSGDEHAVVQAVSHLGTCCCEKKVVGAAAGAAKGAAVEPDDLAECEEACRWAAGGTQAPATAAGQPVGGLLDNRPLLKAAVAYALQLLAHLMQNKPAQQPA